MQSDPKKLAEARYRHFVGKALLFLMIFPGVDYALYLASGGYRNLYGAGHWNLVIAASLFLIAVVVLKPVFRLEEPFQYQLAQKRKAQKQ